MGLPRNTLVLMYVQATQATDITADLLDFSWTEVMGGENKGNTIDVKVRDTDLKYRNKLFIKKGSQVVVEVQMLNWNGDGDVYRSGTGAMFVDTVEMSLRPRTMTFKANSIPPWLEQQGK